MPMQPHMSVGPVGQNVPMAYYPMGPMYPPGSTVMVDSGFDTGARFSAGTSVSIPVSIESKTPFDENDFGDLVNVRCFMYDDQCLQSVTHYSNSLDDREAEEPILTTAGADFNVTEAKQATLTNLTHRLIGNLVQLALLRLPLLSGSNKNCVSMIFYIN